MQGQIMKISEKLEKVFDPVISVENDFLYTLPFYDLYPELKKLSTINWNFSDAKTDSLTHGLHPYPAKFIPQIPHALIKELSSPGETVGDIFLGSGTTLVEALSLRRNAVGIDANPLACLISAAKTTRFHDGDEEILRTIVKRAQNLDSILSKEGMKLFDSAPFTSKAWRPSDKAISFWFEPIVIEELAEALSWCLELPSETSRKVALVALSAIIVSVSKQDSDTRYVRRQKNLIRGAVSRRFAKSLTDAITSVSEFTKLTEPHLTCNIYQANVLEKPNIGMLDLVVCSPPYPNAYSYHLYHMTRMLWIGMDQPKFKREEIGSHRKYSSKGSNAATVDTFRNELKNIFEWLYKHLRYNRYACFVVGDSTIKGNKISNANLISDIAREYGFYEVKRLYRQIQKNKKSFNPAIGKIKEEQILILQNKNKTSI